MTDLFAFGIGHATHNRARRPLEVFFPAPCKQPSAEAARAIRARLKTGVSNVSPADAARAGANARRRRCGRCSARLSRCSRKSTNR